MKISNPGTNDSTTALDRLIEAIPEDDDEFNLGDFIVERVDTIEDAVKGFKADYYYGAGLRDGVMLASIHAVGKTEGGRGRWRHLPHTNFLTSHYRNISTIRRIKARVKNVISSTISYIKG